MTLQCELLYMLEGSHPTTRKLSVDLMKLRSELRKVRLISDNDVAILYGGLVVTSVTFKSTLKLGCLSGRADCMSLFGHTRAR